MPLWPATCFRGHGSPTSRPSATPRATITDTDRLAAAGHTEDEIFEITVAAAVGAALRSFDAGRHALGLRGVLGGQFEPPRTFYSGLFDWGTSEFGGDNHVIDNGPAGAISPREAGFTRSRGCFATKDIDASAKRVHELGGTSEDIQTVPGVGRVAHCQDDQGTPFSLYEPAPRN